MGLTVQPFPALLLPAVLLIVSLAAAPTAVGAASGRQLYAPCVACHQPNAWGSPDGNIPSLAGQQRRYLERQIELFRSGARVDTAMQIVTAHPRFEDAEAAAALAKYLAALNPNPKPVTGPGERLRVGQEIYAHICAACHGYDGRGEAANRVPRIAGQHFPYLKRQIEAAANLHKDLAPPEMTSALRALLPAEKDALGDYISRLGNAEVLMDVNRPSAAPGQPQVP